MRLTLNYRSVITGVVFAALIATEVRAAPATTRVTLDLPASAGQAATSLQATRFSLDAATNLSLVRHPVHTSPVTTARASVVLPASAAAGHFALHGNGSRFAWLSIHQTDAAGATVRRTVLYGAHVAHIEWLHSGEGPSRRITFLADRIHDVVGRAAR